jgi:hypothetical protein
VPCWAQPDGRAQPTNRLDGGLEVAVLQRHGQWAEVLCQNGFRAWVDGNLLASKPRRPGPRWAVALVLVVALGAAVAALVVLAGGDDDPAVVVAELEPTEVALRVPDGWSVSDDGLVVAEDPADLAADLPAGPVVRAEVGGSEVGIDDPAALELRVAGEDFELVEPEEQEVDGFPAVLVTMRGQGRVMVLVAVDPPGQEGATFIIDCPADRFDELQALLASIPGIDG